MYMLLYTFTIPGYTIHAAEIAVFFLIASSRPTCMKLQRHGLYWTIYDTLYIYTLSCSKKSFQLLKSFIAQQ